MRPLLSICIPIYNRKLYLERMLNRFLVDKLLFENTVQLYISDNCSEDDLKNVCVEFQGKGLCLEYHRNDTNLGMEGNFVNCFHHAMGEYVLLLGSDDIPDLDFFTKLLPILERKKYGLVHLNEYPSEGFNSYCCFSEFLLKINVWISFISSNIVSASYIQDVDFSKYSGSMLSQIPLYLLTASKSEENAVVNGSFFLEGNDSKQNSGYNLFQVFISNLLEMIREQVELGLLTHNDFDSFKRLLFKNLLAGEVNRRLLFHKKNYLDISNGWEIVMRYYGNKPYMYYYMMKELIKSLFRRIIA